MSKLARPPFDAFGVVAEECRIPKQFADDMIDGFDLDAKGWKPETENDLFQYCYHVAGAVGCMMAIVMGVSGCETKKRWIERAISGSPFNCPTLPVTLPKMLKLVGAICPKIGLIEMRIDPAKML